MQSASSIPNWNADGVLPPITGETPPVRSPYKIGLIEFVKQFATSPERSAILEGFLGFREELHKSGLASGFQWLDGSFLENIETLENRPPKDLDAVTFFRLPEGLTEEVFVEQNKDIFDNRLLKSKYKIDAYFITLKDRLDLDDIQLVTYWYSMWSHRRNGLWKGYIQIDLSPEQDKDVKNTLGIRKPDVGEEVSR